MRIGQRGKKMGGDREEGRGKGGRVVEERERVGKRAGRELTERMQGWIRTNG